MPGDARYLPAAPSVSLNREVDDAAAHEFLIRRRAINRKAAKKSRSRQKEHASRVKRQYYEAQSVNTKLLYERRRLERHREQLRTQWSGHRSSRCLHRQWNSAPPSLQTVIVQSPPADCSFAPMSFDDESTPGSSNRILSIASILQATPFTAEPSSSAFASGTKPTLSRMYSCPPLERSSVSMTSSSASLSKYATDTEEDSIFNSVLDAVEAWESAGILTALNLVDDSAMTSASGLMAGVTLDTICESADSSFKLSMSSADSYAGLCASIHQQQQEKVTSEMEATSSYQTLQNVAVSRRQQLQQQQQPSTPMTDAVLQEAQTELICMSNAMPTRSQTVEVRGVIAMSTVDATTLHQTTAERFDYPSVDADEAATAAATAAAAAAGITGGTDTVQRGSIDVGLPQSVVDESEQELLTTDQDLTIESPADIISNTGTMSWTSDARGVDAPSAEDKTSVRAEAESDDCDIETNIPLHVRRFNR